MKIVYIAGAMSNVPHYKRKFRRMERKLARQGYIVLNPAWLPALMPYDKAMAIDRAMILTADKVVFMKGWERSKGCATEKRFAEQNGIEVEI